MKNTWSKIVFLLLLIGGICTVSSTNMTERLEYPEYWLEQGVVQFSLHNYDRALSLIDNALKQDPTLSSAWMWRGKVLNKLDRSSEAEESNAKALELDPLILDPFRKKIGALADMSITPIPDARPAKSESKLDEMIQTDVDVGKKPDPTGPDMVLYELDASIPQGSDRLSIVASIGNEGVRPSRDFFITFYGSYETPVTSEDTPIGFYLVSNLLPGTKKTINGFFPISQIPSGNYYIGAYIDPNNEIMEVSETNNGKTATLMVDVPEVSPSIGSQLGNAQLAVPKTPQSEEIRVERADLVVDSIIGPESAQPGDAISVQTTVRNAGDADAGPFRLSMHLSQDTKISSDDIMLGFGDVPDLAAGKAREGSAMALIPAGVKPGTYYLVAMADSLGKVTEKDKQNNSRAMDTPITIGSSSYVVTTDEPSEPLTQSPSLLPDSKPVQTPAPVSSSDEGVVSEPDPGILATEQPALVQDEIDPVENDKEEDTLEESPVSLAEISNSSSGTNEDTLPDLVPVDIVSPNTGVAGGIMEVSTTILNDGPGDAGAFNVSLFLSPDTTIRETEDLIVGMGWIENLLAGKQRTGNATVPIPATIKPGKYYFGLFVDSSREVHETDEENNYGSSLIPIIITTS